MSDPNSFKGRTDSNWTAESGLGTCEDKVVHPRYTRHHPFLWRRTNSEDERQFVESQQHYAVDRDDWKEDERHIVALHHHEDRWVNQTVLE